MPVHVRKKRFGSAIVPACAMCCVVLWACPQYEVIQ